jgi:hypothetical protein
LDDPKEQKINDLKCLINKCFDDYEDARLDDANAGVELAQKAMLD